ncbi:MAG: hydroxyethylthiazole kinase [Campylobacter sp.]|nr:hydroxyethylthiazole kinase [Campylobacter sp.]
MQIIQKIHDLHPLIHCITNYVTANDVANSILSIGASPVMSDEEIEVSQMIVIANALLINIGTLNSRTISAMLTAGKMANALNIPVILDPVGVGATRYRNEVTKKLLENIHFSLIRANVSEISFLATQSGETRGVDASYIDVNIDLQTHINSAKLLAKKTEACVVLSGETDIITNGDDIRLCERGSAMMSKITGSGCMQGGVLAAFLASAKVAKIPVFQAINAGVFAFNIAGEKAVQKTIEIGGANGSFRTFFIDALSQISDSDIQNI